MPRPDIVLVCCDQLRPFELGCYGGPVATPAIDRLAAEGVLVETACSNNPVCSPARAILLSGEYGRSCVGMLGNWGAPSDQRDRLPRQSLPERLRELGYQALHTGKWHVAVHPALLGFENYRHANDEAPWGLTGYFPNRSHGMGQHGEFSPEHEHALLETALRRRDPQRPLFLFHNINLPHGPWSGVPQRYREAYPREAVCLRRNVAPDGRLAHDRRWFGIYEHGGAAAQALPGHGVDERYDLVELTRRYWGMLRCVDEQLGRLVESLRRHGRLEDTILVFTSDHGDNLGSHGRFNKETMNEESIRIPLIVRWGDRLRPRRIQTQLASLVDLAPSLLGLLEAAAPTHWQGRDLAPVLRGEASTVGENAVFIEGMQDDVAIRTPGHLYGIKTAGSWCNRPPRSVADPAFQFFDLRRDPLQQRNLAASAEQAAIAAALRERVLAWDRDTPWLAQMPALAG